MHDDMYGEVITDLATIDVRLVDDAYTAWFNSESESGCALRAWWESRGADRGPAYIAYRVALDREEAAALDLERLWSLTEPCPSVAVGRRTV